MKAHARDRFGRRCGQWRREGDLNTLHRLVLEGRRRDHRGRSFEDVLGFDDSQLERQHYIQWLFPLPEASRFNLDAPVLTPDALGELRASPGVKDNLRRARDRMLAFYRNNDHWLTPFDHNHLRITRIIRCLALVLLPPAIR